MNSILPEGEWEMILGQMVWTEGPAWWNDQLVFSDTILGKLIKTNLLYFKKKQF